MIKGVIMDMDGLMFDSEKLYVRFWCEASKLYGYEMRDEHALAIRSMAPGYAEKKLQDFFGEEFNYYEVREKRRELMDVYVKQHGLEMKKGLVELLDYLKQNGYGIAVATATAKERTHEYLKMNGVEEYFDEVVSAKNCKHGKPMPDIYIEAAKRLGFATDECMALEDSPNGILSAYRAGCKAVMIPDLDEPNEEIRTMTTAVVNSLDEVVNLLEVIKEK